MLSKRTITFGILTVIAILVLVQLATGAFYSSSPRAWRAAQAGMSRQQVFAALGEPAFNTYDLKGQDMWWRRSLLNERRLVVRYDQAQTVERVTEIFHWRGSSD